MIKFYTENLNDKLLIELLPLLELSKKEVYEIKEDNTLANSMILDSIDNNNVNYKYYLEKQRQGLLHISTIRDNNILIGHWTLILNYHAQSKDLLIANCENLHILKQYRKDNNAKKFMKYVEESLKNKGVKQIYFGVNPELKTDILLKRLGWSLDEVIYTKGL